MNYLKMFSMKEFDQEVANSLAFAWREVPCPLELEHSPRPPAAAHAEAPRIGEVTAKEVLNL
jgi:hypothetical protein